MVKIEDGNQSLIISDPSTFGKRRGKDMTLSIGSDWGGVFNKQAFIEVSSAELIKAITQYTEVSR